MSSQKPQGKGAAWLLLLSVLGPLLAPMGAAAATAAPAAVPAAGPAPNDPYFSRQWGMTKIGAPAAWQRGSLGAGITIAIVDTGVDLAHDDLKAKIVAGCDIIAHDNCATPAQDDNGHGTHVAGIAAAETNNGIGVAGVAPDARIMPVKVLDANGSGTDADVQTGVQWAVDHGARVINLSLGSETQGITGSTLGAAVEYAWSHGAIAVVAAGNSYVTGSGFSGEHAIVVSATDINDQKPAYSSGVGSAMWGISAPGGSSFGVSLGDNPDDIWSTWWDGTNPSTYAYDSGTSMATPHVSGAVADLLSQGLTPDQAVSTLLATATPLGQPSTFGHGRLNLDEASAAAAASRQGGASPTSAPRPTVPAGSSPPRTGGGSPASGGGVPAGGPLSAARTSPVASAARSGSPGASPGSPGAAPTLAPAASAAGSSSAQAFGPGRASGHSGSGFPPGAAVAALLALFAVGSVAVRLVAARRAKFVRSP